MEAACASETSSSPTTTLCKNPWTELTTITNHHRIIKYRASSVHFKWYTVLLQTVPRRLYPSWDWLSWHPLFQTRSFCLNWWLLFDSQGSHSSVCTRSCCVVSCKVLTLTVVLSTSKSLLGLYTHFKLLCMPGAMLLCKGWHSFHSFLLNILSIIAYHRRVITFLKESWVCCGPGLETGPRHVGFVVKQTGAGQVFSEFFGFPCNRRSLHQLLHNHPHVSSGENVQ
jgi:hypothetical protein